MDGWIKAHREWMESPLIWKDADHIAVWMFLQLSATHEERQADFCGKIITLKPGQLITGRDHIARHTGVNSKKVDRILKKLISGQLIGQQTGNKGRLISLLNWDSEQKRGRQNGQEVGEKWALSRSNELKKRDSIFKPPTVEEVRSFCRDQNYSIDPQAFVNHYEARGWKFPSGQTMQNWQATVRQWEQRERKQVMQYGGASKQENSALEEHAAYNYTASYF